LFYFQPVKAYVLYKQLLMGKFFTGEIPEADHGYPSGFLSLFVSAMFLLQLV
jgi:hypothetical protein